MGFYVFVITCCRQNWYWLKQYVMCAENRYIQPYKFHLSLNNENLLLHLRTKWISIERCKKIMCFNSCLIAILYGNTHFLGESRPLYSKYSLIGRSHKVFFIVYWEQSRKQNGSMKKKDMSWNAKHCVKYSLRVFQWI